MKTRTLKKLKPIRIIGTIALASAIVLAGVLGFNIYKDKSLSASKASVSL